MPVSDNHEAVHLFHLVEGFDGRQQRGRRNPLTLRSAARQVGSSGLKAGARVENPGDRCGRPSLKQPADLGDFHAEGWP